ncbi:MAG: hypothetical protein AMK71_07195, partial [Nitrospira bacterium SG8_35_4]
KGEVQDIIKSMRKASLDEGKKIARGLGNKLEQIKREHKQYSSEELQRVTEVREGQRVFIQALSAHGLIHSVDKNMQKCKVYVEGKEITLRITDLSEPKIETDEETGRGRLQRAPTEGSPDDIYINPELNVIGMRVDPALSMLERYLNDGSLSGLRQATIIHGIGEGILSKAIRDYAEDHPLVAQWRKGSEDEGGEAVTIIYF